MIREITYWNKAGWPTYVQSHSILANDPAIVCQDDKFITINQLLPNYEDTVDYGDYAEKQYYKQKQDLIDSLIKQQKEQIAEAEQTIEQLRKL